VIRRLQTIVLEFVARKLDSLTVSQSVMPVFLLIDRPHPSACQSPWHNFALWSTYKPVKIKMGWVFILSWQPPKLVIVGHKGYCHRVGLPDGQCGALDDIRPRPDLLPEETAAADSLRYSAKGRP
jgi:hypothetical protein